MRILLGQNSQYFPAHGGGDKSNRLLMEALAARAHACRAVARISVFGEREQERYAAQLAERGVRPGFAGGAAAFERAGVEVRVVTQGNLRSYFDAQTEEFRPEVILISSDDPAQVLLEAALRSQARVVYLARATLAAPFGPDCAFPSASKTDKLRRVDQVVGVSEYVAGYFRRYAGIEAIHVPISLLEPGKWPESGRFDNEFVTLVNPCAVKGIAIFLALADAFPETCFAAVPTWGTNAGNRADLGKRANVRLLDPVDDIDLLLARTRVLLVPSLWAEARSRIVIEAMLRGVPVIASDVGGIPEAKLGVPYLLPVKPIAKYRPDLDEQMVPVAEVPAQDIGPWRAALGRLLSDRPHYEEISRSSRAAALRYAAGLSVEPFERLLEQVAARGAAVRQTEVRGTRAELSEEKKRLLALRLRKRAAPSAWFPGADAVRDFRLFWFPHAGGGAAQAADVPSVCPVRLPGRESRMAEAPFESMGALVSGLEHAIDRYLNVPFAFFGHSMGAAVAFELARALRRAGKPVPRMLIASAARAPQFRRNYVPPPRPGDEQLADELRRLEGTPAEVLEQPALLGALAADAALYRNYVYKDDTPLPCPIRAYGGAADPNIRKEHLEAWEQQSYADFGMRVFPGGHFYFWKCIAEFRTALDEDLRR